MSRRNSMRDSRVWGPRYWYVFHMGACAYPENPTFNERAEMKHYIQAVPLILPCSVCQQHAIKYLSVWSNSLDWVVSSRNNLFVFWWQFHNHVNKSLNKPELSFEKVKEMYPF